MGGETHLIFLRRINMSKQNPNSVVEPSEEELVIYRQFVGDIPEDQMDELANNYFTEVAEGLSISFPKYLINKFIRPIQAGDTINFQTEERNEIYLFCLVREEVEGVTYLLFGEADAESENLNTDKVYLFYVCGSDSIGMEEIDIMAAGPETERILDLLEAKNAESSEKVEEQTTKEKE